jgi:hypothetical protein
MRNAALLGPLARGSFWAAVRSVTRFATYPARFPGGTTTGGDVRFSCSADQAQCKISFGDAMISDQSVMRWSTRGC